MLQNYKTWITYYCTTWSDYLNVSLFPLNYLCLYENK